MFSKKVTPELCKRMRKRAGLSQEELASAMGCSIRTVVTRENKDSKMSLSEFERFIVVTMSTAEDKEARKQIMSKFDQAIDLINTVT